MSDLSRPLETHTFVVISTGHVSQDTARMLEQTPSIDWPCVGGRYSQYGWFIYAHDVKEFVGTGRIPDDLFAVMTWARNQGLEYLLLDCDGDQIEGLPAFDW